ncbi:MULTISPECIES: TRAP transporter substrate-binding protein [unclassified Thioclava]|uniref:TRAP transporter substrate-binding protein n=1 Tax=unclassified Thioclava TaxID=2621713 RepID=UPI000B54398D|nr:MULTISPECIES: TRAP transporter substrate-binding protein [unclassified Thioclava]OWX98794.1 C4-dicarboxylate ABC transporter substrate-binding protein [Thioclava sp. IC9]OWX99667.1 C4-dicarboxylate ABC transporter substrate-binding protein [Thioclava sp. F1Mire-8]OWY07382.1 C4-dicarboxylate ABC transporter substrate-binding protein [Thioclava sp. F42-5]OWY14224.1 C4-dicarboxylate ABC transporter substrate-binding protein [Thioclava sp. JM3]PWE48184.1 C4-dicarboxylate ABC transporter substra
MKKIMMTAMTAALLAGPALAEEQLAVVGSWSSLPLYKQFTTPFWTEELPKLTNGDFSAQLTSFDQMGIAGGDVYRMLGDGVFDVGQTVADYTVGDAPELEGLDVPLVATTADEAKAMVDAARPMVVDIMHDRFNSELLGIAPYPPQVVFCKGEINSLADLKGKKVRGSGRMTTKLLEALGAEGVNIAFSEVPGSLQRGVIDCAVTGAGSGYSAGWWEVSDHLMTLPLGGWDPVVIAMNKDRYDELSPEMQTELKDAVKTGLEDKAWAAAEGGLANDIACLTGDGECKSGDPASMTLVEATDADMKTARDALEKQVLPDWAERAGPEWAKRWNDTVGKTVGVTVPVAN